MTTNTTTLTEEQQEVIVESARKWLEELHAWIIPGAECDEDRDAYDLEAYRIEDALRGLSE